jgi:aminoglycoside phosphotransferase (APT) family kinase protein
MTRDEDQAEAILAVAAQEAGIGISGHELIRDGSNVMYRLSGDIVARVGQPGTADVAEREVQVSRWLTKAGLSVVQALEDVQQPTVVSNRPVTWWKLLPKHRSAMPAELAEILQSLHALDVPTNLDLPVHDPFVKLDRKLDALPGVLDDDREWLAMHLARLRDKYSQLAHSGEPCVIHGDAWQGNVAVPESASPVLLDLEMVSIGDREWDLIQIAVDYNDFARLTTDDYRAFVHAYGGYDVLQSPRFRVFADIQELRWVCFALSKSTVSAHAATEARHRLACLRGEVPRPWSWNAL